MRRPRILFILTITLFFSATGQTDAQILFEDFANLGAPVNDGTAQWHPSISADGLEIYYSSGLVFNNGWRGDADLYVARRPCEDCPWGTPAPLPFKTEVWEGGPSISADGTELYFTDYVSQGQNDNFRPGGPGGGDIWVARRARPEDPWQEPEPLGNVINTPDKEGDPCITNDGRTAVLRKRSRWTHRDLGHSTE